MSTLTEQYKRMLMAKGPSAKASWETLEDLDLSDAAIEERVETARKGLHHIVTEFGEGKADLYELADRAVEPANEALRCLRDGDEDRLADIHLLDGMKVTVENDGSRPAIMVRHGMPDLENSESLKTSVARAWADALNQGANQNANQRDRVEMLRQAIRCVGRIDDPSAPLGFQGTGILVGENVIITNRHVLQAIATLEDGKWRLKPEIAIDFGHEFRGLESVGRRKITSVVFAGAKQIDPDHVDHGKLDLALLELEPAIGANEPQQPVALELAPDWGQKGTGVLIVGYPGDPHSPDPPSVQQRLYRLTYGWKRVSPGYIKTEASDPEFSPRHWSLGHDGSTLGGSSGSGVFVIGCEGVTAGVHYGGRLSPPLENWCHVIGRTLDQTDGKSKKTFGELLMERGVALVISSQHAHN